MRKLLFACAALLIVQPAMAQSVYKCVAVNGGVSYQSKPCPATRQVTAIYPATPEPTPTPRSPSQYQGGNSTNYGPAYAMDNSGSRDREVRRAQCNAARTHRESVLKSVGLSRTFDLLRQLDESVYEACKGL
jgi:hypothetical protein